MEKFIAGCFGRTEYRRMLRYYEQGDFADFDRAEQWMSSLYNREHNAIVEFIRHRATGQKFKTTLAEVHGDLPKYRRTTLRMMIENMIHAKTRQDMIDHAGNYLGEISIIMKQQLARSSIPKPKDFEIDEENTREFTRQSLVSYV